MTALAESANLPLVNTSTTQTNAARDAGQRTQITVRDRTGNIISPGDPDYDMMKAKQESRERRACAHIGLLATPACEGMADPAVEPAALRAAQDEALGLRIALVDAQKRIASLRAEMTAYQTAARAWKDEVTALRAALEPFAELATSAKCAEMPEYAARTFVITAASMLAARAALAGKGDR